MGYFQPDCSACKRDGSDGGNAVLRCYPCNDCALLKGNVGSMFFRENAPQFPSIFGLLLTISAILIIVYVEGMRIEIPITSTKYRGFAGVYPIKLLYVSNIPVILFSALTSNIQFFASYLWKATNPAIATYTSTGLRSLIKRRSRLRLEPRLFRTSRFPGTSSIT